MIVAALLATMLTGYIGGTVEASVLIYTPEPTDIIVQGEEYALDAGSNTITVQLPVKKASEEQQIIVEADSIQYSLPVTILGKRDYSWLWWLLLIPVAALLCSIRFRRIRADNS